MNIRCIYRYGSILCPAGGMSTTKKKFVQPSMGTDLYPNRFSSV